MQKTISLIIPCKNEEKAIALMLKKIPRCINEVIVIDNNSTDKTKKVALHLGAHVYTEKRQIKGIGYGYAHQKGIRIASGDYIIAMDGDATYPLHIIPKIVKYLENNNYDFISCNRFPLKNSKVISKLRRFGVWILNTQVKILYKYDMKDILSGMWLMKKEIANKLHLKSGGWDLSPEIKLAALANKTIKFSQYHIDHKYRYNGDSKQNIWQTGFGHLFYILHRRLTTDSTTYQYLSNLTKEIKIILGNPQLSIFTKKLITR